MKTIHKKFIAILMFLLALMVLVTTSAHFYLSYRFPSDPLVILKKINSDFIQSRFKVIEGRKEGYTDQEMSEYLAKSFTKNYNDRMENLLIAELAIFFCSILVGSGIILIKKESSG